MSSGMSGGQTHRSPCDRLPVLNRQGDSRIGPERMGTTQAVMSRPEEGGVAHNRIKTLALSANARGRHLVVAFPEEVAARLKVPV